MDSQSLDRLEFGRVTAAIAAHAESAGAREALLAWRPIAAREARARENALLAEALRRQGDAGAWCAVGRGALAPRLDPQAPEGLDGPGLLEVLSWLEAARETREAWDGAEAAARFPGLAARAGSLPHLEALAERLARSLEPDGRPSDAASPKLKRARAAHAAAERELEQKLSRWARGFGEESYVTRHGDRFVALVPAAGFPRRRGIVHDVSGSGQSLFVEPLEACDENNRLIELSAEIAEEERRVLRELAEAVRAEAGPLAATEETLVHLDTLRARARWANEVGAIALDPGGDRLRLSGARHPLLAGAGREVVPLDLALGPDDRLLVVSGPNMGGKTVLLKTVGLAVALGHAALPVPAREGSALPEISILVADLGDEQSVDQGLSTFAAHLRSLSAMAEHASGTSLVLCDELGAGTDPDEGAALGRALIEHFAARRAWGVVTTHLGALKRAAAEVAGVCGGSLEFDRETLMPRYRFLPGIPGASHALAVAERLAFPSAVLERARSLTPETTREMERLIALLDESRRRMDQVAADHEVARAAAESAAAEHRAAAESARQELKDLSRRLTRESEGLLARARELWQNVQREARRAEKHRALAGELKAQIGAVEAEAEALRHAAAAATGEAAEPGAGALEAGSLAVGQRVRVLDLGVEAEVASLPDAEGRLTLRRGSWNIQSHVNRLAPAGGPGEVGSAPVRRNGGGATWSAPEEAPSLDVDLRGKEMDDALQALDRGLDHALLQGLSELRIVHGVGRGVLRAAVERHLTGHPLVASRRLGAVGEGGRGVTIVRLR
ncbi:MAG TPA: Smr/MutS family protein [Candidatus Eisenbacteria bacterium]